MKKYIVLALAIATTMPINAQNDLDGFDKFLEEENASFDKFVDEANKEFINFLRNPWKKEQAKKPLEKHTVPEPPQPVVFDEKAQPKDDKPVELTIKDILRQTTKEGQQHPTIEVKTVDQLTFDKPTTNPQPAPQQKVIVQQQKPTTIIANNGNKPLAPKPMQPKAQPSLTKTEPAKPKTEPVKPKAEPAIPQAEPKQQPMPKPAKPKTEPAKPVVEPKQQPQTAPKSQPTPSPSPSRSIDIPTVQSRLFASSSSKVAVNYCEQQLYVDGSLRGICRLANTKERAVADAYEALCRANYKPLVSDCQQARTDFHLNDWGVILFVKKAANALCADGNSSIVMQQFLLNELGYRAKMARRGDRNEMLLFVATNCIIYGHPYFTKDGLNYYNINGTEACDFYICQQDSKKAHATVAMQLTTTPSLTTNMVSRKRTNKAGTVTVNVEVPKSLIDFYASMPQCDYGVYAQAPVVGSVSQQVLATLRPMIAGKSEEAAANLLLNFVQTGFKYATDEEQFGYEKPFFVEELFYYPACDCEDRSVLFAYLVRQLMGLDVVFLDYPNHIATAVAFKSNVTGDYFTVDGKRYIVCDPTYIGASVGQAMPNLKSVAASILHY